jgi:hypothetical protein
MAVGEWAEVHKRERSGPLVAELTNDATDNAVAQVREHYRNTPDQPYPAKTPNPAAEVTTKTSAQHEQQRASTHAHAQPADLTSFPPPVASTRLPHGQPSTTSPASNGRTEGAQPAAHAVGRQGDPMRFLDNLAPAAYATRPGPSLGNGSSGGGARAGHSVNRPTPARNRTPDRGRG